MHTAFQLASLVLVIAWVALPLLLLGALTYALIASRVRRKDPPLQASKFESTGPARF